MIFKAHSKKQEDILLSDKRVTIAGTGIQWGKSTVGVFRLIKDMFTYTDRKDAFLVTSPTYKILYQSTLPVFNYYVGDYGHFDKKNEIFEMHNGGKVYFRTGTNPDSVVGIQDIRHILCDEAGLYSLYFWQNIQARSSIKEAPITIVTSPYALNWLYTEFIRKYKAGDPFTLQECMMIQARSDENPYFPRGEYEKKQRTMDPRRFNMIYGGHFDKAQGLVYDCYDDNKMGISPIKLPLGTRFFGGIDWGYTDPLVIKVRGVTEDGNHFAVDEHYETQMHQDKILDECARMKMLWGIEKYYADPSRPDHISYLNSHGITCIPADNSIELGIERHYELMKSGRYQVFAPNNKYTRDEYETYHYPEPTDLKADQNQKAKINLPVDQNNHCMDAERYLTMATYFIGRAKNKVVKGDDSLLNVKESSVNHDTRLEKLKKRRRSADVSL